MHKHVGPLDWNKIRSETAQKKYLDSTPSVAESPGLIKVKNSRINTSRDSLSPTKNGTSASSFLCQGRNPWLDLEKGILDFMKRRAERTRVIVYRDGAFCVEFGILKKGRF
jgi:hypothetical protein